jgi:hypothetical protein
MSSIFSHEQFSAVNKSINFRIKLEPKENLIGK